MLRALLSGFLALFFSTAIAQDHPAAPPSASATPAVVASEHICGGDGSAPAHAQLLTGYGGGGFPVATAAPAAQAFFDNGMQLAHAFAHRASIAAFGEAARIDPQCAMCLWGKAWASGPTINYPIDAAARARLETMTADAERLAGHGPAKERELIAALKLRYVNGGGTGAGDRAFANAMDVLAARYPDDDEIATLTADAWMILDSLGNKAQHLTRAVTLLERVLARRPDYTPAIHFYIHATEMSGFPGRAERYADRLPALAPSASHLIHMPSHTYYWIGRYQDAVDANVRAVAIGIDNAKRLGMTQPDGVWDLPYHAHNVQFGVGAALISGDGLHALALSDPLIRVAASKEKAPAFMQMVAGTGYFAEARFADPDKVLALPEPKLPYLKAYWHYARGEVYARIGNIAAIRSEAAAIPDHLGTVKADDSSAAAARMAAIARLVLTGRAALLDHQPALALKAFARATKLQEAKKFALYSDPPAWWYPVRRDMAAALLAMGKPADAIRMADATLIVRPKDPVTLALRARAEAATGATEQAATDRRAALAGWVGRLPIQLAHL
jgi:tetratricopeptide (TPR) repeat protein